VARVNFREIKERFTHLDGRFKSCSVNLPEAECSYAVDIYPWWEHPDYLAAVGSGQPWGFRDVPPDAYRTVTVYPIDLVKASMSRLDDVIDWEFTSSDPMLWAYESKQWVYCNSPLTLEQTAKLSQAIQSMSCGYSDSQGVLSFERIYRYSKCQSFCLGDFPRALLEVVLPALDEMSIPYYCAGELAPAPSLVLFAIDSDNYMIAKDFEVDVPEFIHKPEWFNPRVG